MNYYTAKELAESFRTVRKNTLVVAQDIPQEKYAFRAAPDTRSVGELLTHIAISHGFQYQVHATDRRATLEGFDFPSLIKGAQRRFPGRARADARRRTRAFEEPL
jgi:xanthine/CO dehydrogenase XdhC/CoxF family maturation factor